MVSRFCVAGKFLQRHAYFVTGMKLEIETQRGLHRRGGARQVFAGFLRFQNCRIGVEDMDFRRPDRNPTIMVWPRSARAGQQERSRQTTARLNQVKLFHDCPDIAETLALDIPVHPRGRCYESPDFRIMAHISEIAM